MSKLASFGWLTILAAVAAFALHFYVQRMERSMKYWPTASALIRSSHIVKTKQASLKTSLTSTAPNRDPRYAETDVWALDIEYTFDDARGNAISGYTATSLEYAEPVKPGEASPGAQISALAARLPAGSTTEAHYDPANSQDNYLIYMESPGNRTLLITAWVLLSLGILLIAVPLWIK